MSMNFIVNYQTEQTSDVVVIFYNVISFVCSTPFVVGLLGLLHFVLKRKFATSAFIYYIVLNAYLMALQKQLYQDPRPFAYDSRVRLEDWIC